MLEELLIPMALEGSKKVAATFGVKFGTAVAGAALGKAINTALDEALVKEIQEGKAEQPDPNELFARHVVVDALSAAAGAVAFVTANDNWISK